MRIYDLSVPIHEGMSTWPGDPVVQVQRVLSQANGDGINVSRLVLGTHAGTHVDAPAHLLAPGATVDHLPLASLVGPVTVVAITDMRRITAARLQDLVLPHPTRRLLLKTLNSTRRAPAPPEFASDYVALTVDAAAWLVRQEVVLVGIDGPSVDPRNQEKLPAHRALLGHGVIVIEGLDMSQVVPGCYELCCLPLKIAGGDGAPARVILIDRQAMLLT